MASALLVEDNETFRESLKEALHFRFPSMEILEAGDGKEAIEKVTAFPPDMIFMDIKLPGENGLSLTRKIKAKFPQIVVFILTSYDLPEYREAAFQYSANYFFTKSSPTDEIIGVVESVLADLNKNGKKKA